MGENLVIIEALMPGDTWQCLRCMMTFRKKRPPYGRDREITTCAEKNCNVTFGHCADRFSNSIKVWLYAGSDTAEDIEQRMAHNAAPPESN